MTDIITLKRNSKKPKKFTAAVKYQVVFSDQTKKVTTILFNDYGAMKAARDNLIHGKTADGQETMPTNYVHARHVECSMRIEHARFGFLVATESYPDLSWDIDDALHYKGIF